MEDIGGFYIVWQDDTGDIIKHEWLDKGTLPSAVRAAALRMYQSPHLCPENVAGFFIVHTETWIDSKNIPSLDKRIQKLQDAEMLAKYGPPPPGFGEVDEPENI